MIKNIFSNWTGFFVNVAIALLLSPLIVHSLGASVYGVWILIGSLTGYLGILDLGVRASLVKYVAEYIAQKDFEALNETFNTSLVTFLLIGAVTVLVSCMLPLALPLLLSNSALDDATMRWAIMLVGCDIALSFPLGLYGGFLSGLQRYDLSNLIEIVSALGRALATVIVLKLGYGIVALASIALASSVLASIFRIAIVPARSLRFVFV